MGVKQSSTEQLRILLQVHGPIPYEQAKNNVGANLLREDYEDVIAGEIQRISSAEKKSRLDIINLLQLKKFVSSDRVRQIKVRIKYAYSAAEESLLAAESLDQPFTVDQLCVALWERDAERFGILGGRYPNKHTLMSILSVRSSPVKRGWFTRLRANTFRISGDGRRKLEELKGGE